MIEFSKLEAIIFDLDGTLYADTDHFVYFSSLLAAKLPDDKRDLYMTDEQRVIKGEHVLRMGRVYDRRNDLVLETTPDGHVLRAWQWEGIPVPEPEVYKLYREPVQFDMHWMISIGDGWWIPTACAYHYGVESTYDAYLKTKDYLSGGGARLTPIPGVREALMNLKDIKLIVATNSDLADTERILKKLDLWGLFAGVYPDSQKPKNTLALFNRIMREQEVNAEKCLSVGDNYLNEIYPAAQLGMQTCLVDPYRLHANSSATVVVRSLSELFLSK